MTNHPDTTRGRSFRGRIRAATEPFGLDQVARRVYLEAGLVGERLRRAFMGIPDPRDAVVLLAGGRSGSTWVADILSSCGGVQQIFEPLHPSTIEEVRRLTGWDESHHPHIRSIYLRPEGNYPDWDDLLLRVLTGRMRNYWTDVVRTSLFPSHYVVKVIRANLMAGHIVDRMAPRVVFLIRHPCAVVASRLAVGWHADVEDILAQEELVEDHLRPWLREIEAERDLLGAHAVWWAVETRVAALDLSTRPHYFTPYESILQDPLTEMRRMIVAIGLSPSGLENIDFQLSSRMTSPDVGPRVVPSAAQRWRGKLDMGQVDRIVGWARRLGVDWYAENGTPRIEPGRVARPAE